MLVKKHNTMKKLLFQLLLSLLPFAATAQNCDFTFNYSSSTGTITLNAPGGLDPNQYVFLWTLNGGFTNLYGPQASYTYNQSTVDNITLNVFQALPDSNFVCSSSQTVTIIVDNPTNNCPIIVSQSGNTFSFSVPGANYPGSWNFGDGNTASGFNVTHTYANEGQYQVCVNVTGGGFTCNSCVGVDVTADTTTNPQVSCNSFCVTDVSQNSPVLGYFSITIAYNDAPMNMIFNPYIDYVTNLNGDVIAIGNWDGISYQNTGTFETYFAGIVPGQSWNINEPVNIHFTFNDQNPQTCILSYPCLQPPINCNADFYASTSALTGYYIATGNTMSNATSYLWNFGDGTSATGPYVYHQYDAGGTYTVCMIQTTPTCSDTICQQVVIPSSNPTLPDSLCNAEFAITQQNPGEVIVINGSSGNNLTFTWSISGNGLSITAQGAYPEISVEASGSYLLCLTVSSPNCSTTYCDSLIIDENGMWNGKLANAGFVINVMSPQQVTGFVTSVLDIEENQTLLYPNPFTDFVFVSATKASTYEILTIDGKRMQSGNLPEGQSTISASDLASGIYFFVQTSNGSKKVSKIVKH